MVQPEVMIRNIVFDFGGVLVDWNPRYLYNQLSSDSEKIDFFLTQICHSEWNLELDAGKPFSEAISEQTARFPEYKEWIQLYQSRWNEMLRSEISGTVAILEELSEKQTPLYGLTNWSEETFPHALERFSFFKHFKGIVVSGTEKCIKPDPKIFDILCRRYSLNPTDCLFIDDVQKNTHAASDLGFITHTFKTPEILRRFLTHELKLL